MKTYTLAVLCAVTGVVALAIAALLAVSGYAWLYPPTPPSELHQSLTEARTMLRHPPGDRNTGWSNGLYHHFESAQNSYRRLSESRPLDITERIAFDDICKLRHLYYQALIDDLRLSEVIRPQLIQALDRALQLFP